MTAQHTLTNGIPTWWAESAGPFAAALHFRVGTADEPLPLAGVTHLIQHLVTGAAEQEHHAWVDATHCIFFAEGERADVLDYLRRVGTALAAPDLRDLEDERRALYAEGLDREPTLRARMLIARYGLDGYGLGDDEEYGLRWIGEEEVRAWWAAHFTRGNAGLWMLGEPPSDLGFALPDGPRVPPPVPNPLPAALPAFMADGTGGVVLTGIVPRTAATVALDIAAARLPGAHADVLPVGSDHAHLLLGLEGEDEDAPELLDALWSTLHALAEHGPTDEELAAVPATVSLGRHVIDELDGRTDPDAPTDSAAVTAVMRAWLDQAILLGPDGSHAPEGLANYVPPPTTEPLDGERFLRPRPGRLKRREDGELWIGERAVGVRDEEPIAWADVVAGEQYPDASLRLIARDGRFLDLDPLEWEDGERATRLAREKVGRERLIPARI
ncbi:hypothetical protein OJ997_20415 [Solirubrobacter phytolaccae]|uniref:Insulinase family protein n=1 Tax=Solirubrobacter phytolaccae TaxID=1404360 RepID=A0A9X3SGR0_9ACTN|nr:hypothetical protein [Solirubrobacter phytolaccae]MDA0182687.1 hypothetical protein [Solirubrobacter phytolaccae]